MDCVDFEVGCHSAQEKIARRWNREQIVSPPVVRFLRFRNLRGDAIYIRPRTFAQGRNFLPIVLVDDITREAALKTLPSHGYRPAVVVETSPDNYQAWVRLSGGAITDADTLRHAARYLCRLVGGDPGAAKARQFGRLAGFYNHKPERRLADGRSPLVKMIRCERIVAEAGADLLRNATTIMNAQDRRNRPGKSRPPPRRGGAVSRDEAVSLARAGFIHLEARYAAGLDFSRADWSVVCRLLSRGAAIDDAAHALLATSPDLAVRKKGHIADYVFRTLVKAASVTGVKVGAVGALLDNLRYWEERRR